MLIVGDRDALDPAAPETTWVHWMVYDIAATMRYAGKSLEEAVTHTMRNTLQPDVGGVIAVSAQGDVALQHNTQGMSCGVADSSGRFEVHLKLNDGALATHPANSTSAVDRVRKLLEEQAAAWNEGNIDRFMQSYWDSNELTFSSAGQVTRGYEATMARYKARYPDRQAMGHLTFQELEFLELGSSAMQVQGIWQLQRDAPIGGRFTLVLRKFSNGWKIVHDHTSVRVED